MMTKLYAPPADLILRCYQPWDPRCPNAFERPSQWLRAGYARFEFPAGWYWTEPESVNFEPRSATYKPGAWWWVHVRADQPVRPYDVLLDPAQLDELFRAADTRALLQRLADAFSFFLPIAAGQWELDLRQSLRPETLLRLWESVLGVFEHYVAGKKYRGWEHLDYFWLVLRFYNHGPERARQLYPCWSLKPGRVERVVAEIDRWFRRFGSLEQSRSTDIAASEP